MIDKTSSSGEWLIEHIKDGKIIKTERIKNLITDAYLNAVADGLAGTPPDIEIKYLALGTGDTAPAATNTALVAEVFRTPETVLSRIAVGRTRSEFSITDSEALSAIKEIGVFCGASATSTANTGLLLSRILWSSDRTSNPTAVRFIRVDTIERN